MARLPAPTPAPPPESAEMVQEILLKLPTRDRSVVADPNFPTLHAKAEANHVSAAPPEALLVTVTREAGRPDEASFFRASSPKPTAMPHRVTIPSGYRLSNVCNGLLCFSLVRDIRDTGETATVPKAPPPVGFPGGTIYHHFALAFSPSTKEHKLFRFTFSPFSSIYGATWTRACSPWTRSFRSQCPLLVTCRPLLIQGKLYLVTTGQTRPEKPQNPDGLLEVDDPLVNACEMGGPLCLAVDILWGVHTTVRVRKIQFWVLMSSLPPPDRDDSEARWELRYSFHAGGNYVFDVPRSAWFDDTEKTLCYKDYEVVYKHGTRGRSPEPSPDADCLQCDRRVQLAPTPSNCQWNIFGGYRPSLLSPLALTPPPSCWDGEEERQKFEHTLLLSLE
ncbi:hypothetical protein VPH35_108184 [Triticum aestivum]